MSSSGTEHHSNYWNARHQEALAQEQGLHFDTFDHHDAWRLGNCLVDLAQERALPVTIVVKFGEQRVFHTAMSGTSATNDDWLDRKCSVVAKHDCSSYAIYCEYQALGIDYYRENGYSQSEFAVSGGAVPLRIQGRLIGAVGVSGLEHDRDHELAIEALRTHWAEHRRVSAELDSRHS